MTRLWLAVIALWGIGLITGGPLHAEKRGSAGPAHPVASSPQKNDGTDKNFLNWLSTANANLEAAAKSRMSDGSKMPMELADRLVNIEGQVKESRAAWTQLGGKASTIVPPSPAPTLEEQLERATIALVNATRIAERLPAADGVRVPLKKAILALASAKQLSVLPNAHPSIEEDTASSLPIASRITPSESTAEPSASGQPSGTVNERDEVAADPEERTKRDQEVKQGKAEVWQIAASGGAILLALVALSLALLPRGNLKELQSKSEELDADLRLARTRQASLEKDVENLGEQFASLQQRVTSRRDRVSRTHNAAEETDTTRTMTPAVGMEQSSSVQNPAAQGLIAGVLPGPEEIEANVRGLFPKVQSQALPKDLEPVAKYNEARKKRAFERAAEFGKVYPKQMQLACVNPAARNSGPFTDLRFKEDEHGKFVAVPDGKQTLLFPDLTYDYTTGRKTLEGVFEYPETESEMLSLQRAGTVEKRGDEWILTTQGAFQNA